MTRKAIIELGAGILSAVVILALIIAGVMLFYTPPPFPDTTTISKQDRVSIPCPQGEK